MGYTSSALKGISWMGLLRGSTRAVTFIRLAILARILTPAEFGAFGVATLVLSFLEILTETGINIFLIQQKGDIKKYLSSAWIVSIIRGCLMAILLVTSASFISDFFNSPESYPVILLISLVPFIRGFINPAIINIQKEIQFQKEFYLRFTLFVIDASIAIFAALITRSAESFAYGLIASAIIEVILSFAFFKPFPTLSFSIEKIKHIVKRGWWVTVTGIFSYSAENGDNIIVGKLLGTSSLGIYQVAYKFSTLPISEITDVVNKVVFPVYSRFSEDKDRLWKAFVKVFATSSVLAVFLGAFIFLFAEQIISVLLGSMWAEAVPVVKVLAFYGILRTIFGNFAPLFLSLGKQDFVAKMTFFRVLALLVTIGPLINLYGLVGAGFSALISILVEIPIAIFLFYKVYTVRK
ncbi:MAG: Membrane protein involved in the export of O-antigen and teichoic acid [Microgenomates group bacterium GW2011_GWA2_37_6]|nr:MAG: Membrane protein involved in the export of O-antigen and teichoic acid [Microgenomates group bacterium GW2011_GWA2_37_6]